MNKPSTTTAATSGERVTGDQSAEVAARQPAQTFCLAECLSDEIVARGWKSETAAVRMKTSRGAAMDLFILDLLLCVQGTEHGQDLIIDEETFDGLGRAFDVEVQFFKNIDAAWRRSPLERRCPFEPPDEIFGPTSRRAMIRPVAANSAPGSAGKMTPGARRILEDLAADENCDLLREGIRAYCGNRPVASRCVTELVWAAAIHSVSPQEGSGARYYAITSMGRCYLRRPELEQEYYEAVRVRGNRFTIKDDRIAPLPNPLGEE